MNNKALMEQFRSPSPEHRGMLFWAWNGDLDQKELELQAEDFKRKGFGGFFMHSREGLETEYLSDKWLELVNALAQKGEDIGLIPWIYDEDKWPSGMAGGQVTGKYPQFAATAITLGVGVHDGDFLYKADIEDATLHALYPITSSMGVPITIRVEQSSAHDWYNGNPPADNLNPDSVNSFLNITHEAYRQAFGGTIEGKVAGFFTDEPNFADFFSFFTKGRPWLPWTPGFEAVFMARRGYDIIPQLLYLFFEGSSSSIIRHDYWRTLTEHFSESYFKQIYDWCENYGVKSSGHLLFENGLGYQARVCGAVMPHMRYLHVPGMDLLGEQTEEYVTVKQASSVANQFGRTTVSETNGCTGWAFSFEGQKWLWDWQSVLGIHSRCEHLAPYSIKGLRKRDYPPFFNYQSDWWRHAAVLEEYCARLSLLTSAGTVHRPILVIHPQSSVWTECGSHPDENLGNFDANIGWTDPHILGLNEKYADFNMFSRALSQAQCDYDYGDEIILSEYGSTHEGKLRVNYSEYELVIVPKVRSLFDSTLKLLREFVDGGGRVIWVDALPALLEGQISERCSQLFGDAEIVPGYSEAITIAKAFRKVNFTDIETMQCAALLVALREVEGGHLVTVVNNKSSAVTCLARFDLPGQVYQLDLLTGEQSPIARDKNRCFYTSFAAKDSCAYWIDGTVEETYEEVRPPYHDPHESKPVIACLEPYAAFNRTMANTLVLDTCRYKIGTDSPWSETMQVWQAQKQVREQAGFMQIYGNGMPMRYTWIREQKQVVHLFMRFEFTVDTMPSSPLSIAIEESEHMRVFCNGKPCTERGEYLLDKAIQQIKLDGVHEGLNSLEFEITYTHDMELEDIYLCGDFGVDMKRHIVSEPLTLHLGDWCLQGYPNYAGSMIYQFRFNSDREQGYLCLGNFSAMTIVIKVNGGEVRYIPWQAADGIPLQLNQGENQLEIEVVGSNRNLFGPLHQKYTCCSRIDWRDFRTQGDYFTEDLVLHPYGLFGPIYIKR